MNLSSNERFLQCWYNPCILRHGKELIAQKLLWGWRLRMEEMMDQLMLSGATFGHTKICIHSIITCEQLARFWFMSVKATKMKRVYFQT
jgi:hypothetical protein